ncbi:recombinase family protein [Sinomonas gamaensis]|uniref:recombinase family protein n=1 Tax=Sinomonas gamaensis TaxID=2565624 RepID=UPI0011082A3A|nr:recombinase family protein [Sinomonas gamaensis]
MIFGYTRVSSVLQDAALQRRALLAAGVDEKHIFSDEITGASAAAARPAMAKLLDYLRPGDELLVWRIDRLGRSVADMVATVELLQEKGVKLRSLVEQIDPDTPNGRLILNFMAVLAEHERQLNSERTKAGMAAARARGVKFGRKGPDAKTIAAKLAIAKSMLAQNASAKEAAKAIGWSRSTLYRHLREQEAARSGGVTTRARAASKYAVVETLPFREAGHAG